MTAPGLGPGQPVRVSVGAANLTRICLALFGPPLAVLLLAGWLTTDAVAASWPTFAVAAVAALGIALVCSAGLGRRLSAGLAIVVVPMTSTPGDASEV